MFPMIYEDALEEWVQLRAEAKELPFEDSLHLIHNWWQQAPMINHNLHIADYMDWPGPWQLLADNNYCEVAKCLGICYTLLVVDNPEIISMKMLQSDNYTYIQLLTDTDEYVLNDQPGLIKADLSEVKILHTVNCFYFRKNI